MVLQCATKQKILLSLLAASLLLSAAASTQPECRKRRSARQQNLTQPCRSLAWPSADWWQNYRSEPLEALIPACTQAATSTGPNRRDYATSRDAQCAAGAALLPQVDASISTNPQWQ